MLKENCEPRDLKQIQNRNHLLKHKDKLEQGIQHCSNIADNILALMSMASQKHDFVKAVVQIADHPPAVICYTENMIDDMRSALKNESQTILGIDKTYNLGPCFVTSLVYSNYAFTRKSESNAPIFWGPMYFHGASFYEDFQAFLSHISTKLRGYTKIKIGSDDEKALVGAIEDVFVKWNSRHSYSLYKAHKNQCK